LEPCRKCGTPNPKSNQYCKNCGAVLSVATFQVKAHISTLFPVIVGFRWRWVLLGVPVLLGTVFVSAVGIAALLGVMIRNFKGGSLLFVWAKTPIVAIISILLFMSAFTLGGFMIARVSGKHTVAEPAVASLFVLLCLTLAGFSVSTDAIWVGALFALPCALMGAIGGGLGGLGKKKNR